MNDKLWEAAICAATHVTQCLGQGCAVTLDARAPSVRNICGVRLEFARIHFLSAPEGVCTFYDESEPIVTINLSDASPFDVLSRISIRAQVNQKHPEALSAWSRALKRMAKETAK